MTKDSGADKFAFIISEKTCDELVAITEVEIEKLRANHREWREANWARRAAPNGSDEDHEARRVQIKCGRNETRLLNRLSAIQKESFKWWNPDRTDDDRQAITDALRPRHSVPFYGRAI